MKVQTIEINGVGGINYLKLDFNTQMNLICGGNGVGKTTILECIAHSFGQTSTSIINRNVAHKHGTIKTAVSIGRQLVASDLVIEHFSPRELSQTLGLYKLANKVFVFKVTRNFNYQPLDSVKKDTFKTPYQVEKAIQGGIPFDEIKNWLVNRYLYSAHEGVLTKEQIHNFTIAKNSFSLLRQGFHFSKVVASSNEIMINSPDGEIYYEYLSSGFKSCLSIIIGIIKEIEFRFQNPSIKADDFDGVILIDELEVHLHPEWQAKIANILVELFPKVQFITTTHSPHVI